MKNKFQRILTGLIGAAVVAGVVYAFLPQPVDVDLATAKRGALMVSVDEEGKTRIKERYVVSTPLSGRLLRVELDAGDTVEAGKTLLTAVEPTDPSLLDDRARAEAQARVAAAEATVGRARAVVKRAQTDWEYAKSEAARERELARSRVSSEQAYAAAKHAERLAAEDVRTAEFAVRIAEYEVEQARSALLFAGPASEGAPAKPGRFEIRAPIDGRVLRVLQESAAVLPAGAPLMEIGDTRDLEIVIDVLSRDAVRVQPGADVVIEHWGGDEVLRGRVRLVEPAAYTKVSALGIEEQRVDVIVDFADAPETYASLGDGYRVEARIVVWRADDVLQVPAGALFRSGGEWALFRAEERVARLRRVKVGRTDGITTEIVEGLGAGDTVVLHPSDRVADGVKIVER